MQQAVGLIINQLTADLVDDQTVSARNFGTLSPYLIKGHLAHDISTGEVRELEGALGVRLHPHEAFRLLLSDRREKFQQTTAENRSEKKS